MEFTAIILCGEGSRLSPFSAVRASGTAKALLPVDNKPLIGYGLDWCEKANFNKVLISASNSDASEIRHYVDNVYKKDHGPLPIEIVESDSKSTSDIVRSLGSKIKKDFVILPCDFLTDISPTVLIDMHRNKDQDVLITGLYYENKLENIEKKSLISDYIVHTPLKFKEVKLLDIYDKELVTDNKSLNLRMSMLWRYSNAVVSSSILRAAIFFCNNKVLSIMDSGDIQVKDRSWNKVIRDFARRSWSHGQPLETVAMKLIPEDSTFIRANSISAYLEANRYIMKQNARQAATIKQSQVKSLPNSPQLNAIKPAAVGGDSTVGDGTTLGERSNVKKSVIGANCTIGKKCRITGSVMMDGVVIEDDVILDNCLIGRKAIVRLKSKLTSCNVEGGYDVPKSTQAKNETLQNLSIDGLLEEDFMSEESEDEDEDEDESTDASNGDKSEEEWEESEGEEVYANDDLFDRS